MSKIPPKGNRDGMTVIGPLEIRLPSPVTKCEVPHCENMQWAPVWSRREKKILLVCETHVDSVCEDSHDPEYRVHCPNCDCWIPVN